MEHHDLVTPVAILVKQALQAEQLLHGRRALEMPVAPAPSMFARLFPDAPAQFMAQSQAGAEDGGAYDTSTAADGVLLAARSLAQAVLFS